MSRIKRKVPGVKMFHGRTYDYFCEGDAAVIRARARTLRRAYKGKKKDWLKIVKVEHPKSLGTGRKPAATYVIYIDP